MVYVAGAISLLIIGAMCGAEFGSDLWARRMGKKYEQLEAAWRELDAEKARLEKMNRMMRVTSQVQTDIRRLRRHSIRDLERWASAAPPGGRGRQ